MLKIVIPETSFATAPPEERGLSRDHTRLMVFEKSIGKVTHCHFHNIVEFLVPGDTIVINISATIPACLEAKHNSGKMPELRLSQKLFSGLWIVEINCVQLGGDAQELLSALKSGDTLELPNGSYCILHVPYGAYYSNESRLWIVSFVFPEEFLDIYQYLYKYAHPHHFYYHAKKWDLSHYQTVYASEPGSAEMHSAGRGFTTEIITKLVARGVNIVPIVLHAGTNSEGHIPPIEEYYRVPLETAFAINNARALKKRVISVGTTVLRALETVTDVTGLVYPGEGWTQRFIAPESNILSVDGLLTGLHDPETSHVNILMNFCSEEQLESAYSEALSRGYLWHEFGDFHLLLP